MEKGTLEGVRVRAARPSADLKAAAEAAGIKFRTLERARAEMEAMRVLYHWQVGGQHWLVLPDVVQSAEEGSSAGSSDGTKATKKGNGGATDKSSLGDKGMAIH